MPTNDDTRSPVERILEWLDWDDALHATGDARSAHVASVQAEIDAIETMSPNELETELARIEADADR